MPTLIELIRSRRRGAVSILCCSRISEPSRRNFNAIMIAGAGAAYLNGGLGIWEFAFTPVITFLAFKGLQDYCYIGAGWLMHTAWDLVHHRYGTPIVPFAPNSSAGRARSGDLVLALWCSRWAFDPGSQVPNHRGRRRPLI